MELKIIRPPPTVKMFFLDGRFFLTILTGMAMQIEDVIIALGGPREAAVKCDITPDAVRKWRRIGIPPLQWKRISRATDISLDELAAIERPGADGENSEAAA